MLLLVQFGNNVWSGPCFPHYFGSGSILWTKPIRSNNCNWAVCEREIDNISIAILLFVLSLQDKSFTFIQYLTPHKPLSMSPGNPEKDKLTL